MKRVEVIADGSAIGKERSRRRILSFRAGSLECNSNKPRCLPDNNHAVSLLVLGVKVMAVPQVLNDILRVLLLWHHPVHCSHSYLRE